MITKRILIGLLCANARVVFLQYIKRLVWALAFVCTSKSSVSDLFKTYFMDNFILIADKKKIKYNFIGFEKRNDLLQFYIEFSLDDKIKNLSISNKILFSSFSNQKNLILFRSEFTRKSFIQSRNKHTNQISF